MPTFLKKEFEDSGFKVQEIIENVLLVEDFLTEQELHDLFEIINSTPEEDWRLEYLTNLKHFCMEKFGRDDVDNLVAEGKFEITQNWEDKNLDFNQHKWTQQFFIRVDNLIQKSNPELQLNGLKTFQRMQEGVQLKSHTDQHTDPSIKYATIIYLNDDYVDGEFFFENKDIQLRPKPGSLLIFPGNDEFEHGVRFVSEGPIRYVIVGFIRVKDFYKENKY